MEDFERKCGLKVPQKQHCITKGGNIYRSKTTLMQLFREQSFWMECIGEGIFWKEFKHMNVIYNKF